MGSIKKNLLVDAVVLVVYLVVANPAFTGISMHEWLSLGVFVIFLVHCIAHYDWIVDVACNLSEASWAGRGNLVLDILILVAFVAVTISGLGISGTVLPTFGLFVDGYYFWNPLHSVAAKVLLSLLLVHVVVHWKLLYSCFKREKEVKDARH